jgi:predicted NUDIX family NTP pyrophosphohydrolase
MASTRISAGLLMYRHRNGELEVFLAHPGGPYFLHKDEGYWTIPKGEIEPGEDLLAAAIREFEEETGIKPEGKFMDIGTIRQKGGKIVHGWAFQGNWDESQPIKSNQCPIEWPPASGQYRNFPEVDRAEFFPIPDARRKLKETQRPFLDRLIALAAIRGDAASL